MTDLQKPDVKPDAFPEHGVTVSPDREQFAAWTAAAGETPLETWLAELGDDAAVRMSYDKRVFPIVIKLREPVQFGQHQLIEELRIRKGRLSDLDGVSLGERMPIAQLNIVAARMTGQTTHVIGRLGADDAGEIISVVLDFFGRCVGGGRGR